MTCGSPPVAPVDSLIECATGSCRLTAVLILLRSIGLTCRGHQAVALENLAVRQQLPALTRTRKRVQLRPVDRLFWILLSKAFGKGRTGHAFLPSVSLPLRI